MKALEAMEVRVMKERREMDGLVFMGEADCNRLTGRGNPPIPARIGETEMSRGVFMRVEATPVQGWG